VGAKVNSWRIVRSKRVLGLDTKGIKQVDCKRAAGDMTMVDNVLVK
jgi:hypothetical protein